MLQMTITQRLLVLLVFSAAGVIQSFGSDPSPDQWSFRTLYSFSGFYGSIPTDSVLEGVDGKFYGSTQLGGSNGVGVVYRIDRSGSFQPLQSFLPGRDGSRPATPLIKANDANLWGTTVAGGSRGNHGTIFSLRPDAPLFTVFSFGGTDGSFPSDLVRSADGTIYGACLTGGYAHKFAELFKAFPEFVDQEQSIFLWNHLLLDVQGVW